MNERVCTEVCILYTAAIILAVVLVTMLLQ